MIQDALATFSTAQATSSTSYAGTDILDNTINAVGYPTNPDAYVGAWFVVRVAASATAPMGNVGTIQFQLQTSTGSAFTDGNGTNDITLCQSTAYSFGTLTAGKYFAARIPPGMRRFVRAFYVVSTTGAFPTLTTDAFITKDIDMTVDKRFVIS